MAAKFSLDEIDKLYEHDLFIPTRTIYMGSFGKDWEEHETGVDFTMAESVIKSLMILETIAPKAGQSDDITIIMNNPGGDWYHGMAIYDAIKSCPHHITIKVYAHAMSMGSIILQAADERVMMPNSRLMIHYGYSGHNNHSKVVQKWAEEDKKIASQMEAIYLEKIREKNPKFTVKKMREMLSFDTILSAEETVALGLADRVF
jgi:ATP-dependent Clp protease protease subunit